MSRKSLHTSWKWLNQIRRYSSQSSHYNTGVLGHIKVDTENHSIIRNLKNIQQKIKDSDHSFFEVDLGHVVKQFDRWTKQLPRVKPFYAVKCHPDENLVGLLATLGAGFDCATYGEIQMATHYLNTVYQDFDSDYRDQIIKESIIVANTFKFQKDMTYAEKYKVSMTTFDSIGELYRMKQFWPGAKLVLRVAPPRDTSAQCPLGDKFGAKKETVKKLIDRAKQLGFDVIGVSFHVGSMCYDFNAWSDSVEYCSDIFKTIRDFDYRPYLLDIGGGFPGCSAVDSSSEIELQNDLDEMFGRLNTTLDKHFPVSGNFTLIAEPGTFFAFGAFTLATQIIGKRKMIQQDFSELPEQNRVIKMGNLEAAIVSYEDTGLEYEKTPSVKLTKEKYNLYVLDDGIYGSFNILMFSDYTFLLLCVMSSSGVIKILDENYPRPLTKVYGPTCDAWDCIFQGTNMPHLPIGDWLIWADMGAYTIATKSDFNYIDQPTAFYHISQADRSKWIEILRSNMETRGPITDEQLLSIQQRALSYNKANK